MRLELNLPDEVAEFLEKKAASLGMTPEQLAVQLIEKATQIQFADEETFFALTEEIFDKYAHTFEVLAESDINSTPTKGS